MAVSLLINLIVKSKVDIIDSTSARNHARRASPDRGVTMVTANGSLLGAEAPPADNPQELKSRLMPNHYPGELCAKTLFIRLVVELSLTPWDQQKLIVGFKKTLRPGRFDSLEVNQQNSSANHQLNKSHLGAWLGPNSKKTKHLMLHRGYFYVFSNTGLIILRFW